MVDSRAGVGYVQDEPGTYCYAKRKYKKMMVTCHKDKGAHLRGLPLDKSEAIWAPKLLRMIINYQSERER